MQVAQGDLAGALKSYRDSLAIGDRLAKSDPGNADWQRDLSVSYNKVGDVQVAQGDLAGALKSYRDSLAIADRLAKSDPGNAGWQRDLSVSYAKLASAFRRAGDNATALDLLRQGRAIMVRMTGLSPDNAVWKRDLASVRRADRGAGALSLVQKSYVDGPRLQGLLSRLRRPSIISTVKFTDRLRVPSYM